MLLTSGRKENRLVLVLRFRSYVLVFHRTGWSKINSTQNGAVQINFDSKVNWDLLGISMEWYIVEVFFISFAIVGSGVGPSAQLWQGWAMGDFDVRTNGTYV